MRALNTTRTRTESILLPAPYEHPNSGTAANGIIVTFDDTNESGFYKKQAEGLIVMNDMRRHEDELEDSVQPYSYNIICNDHPEYNSNGTSTVLSSSMVGSVAQMPSSELNIDSLVDKAVIQMMGNGNATEAMVLVTLAEAKKTANWAKSFMQRASKMVFATARLKRKVARGLLNPKQASRKWLEYRYAIRPLIYEGKQLVDAFNNVGNPKRTHFYGYAEDSYESSDVSKYWTGINVMYGKGRFNIDSYYKESAEVTAGMIVDWPKNKFKTIDDTFGTSDYLQAAWELVPYSFVMDWFVDIGGFISAWSPHKFNVLGSYATVTHWQEIGKRSVNYEDEIRPGWQYTLSMGTLKSRRAIRSRTRYANPSLSMIPPLDINLDLGKITDLVSLVIQRCR